ncbi:monocarboxylate transporter 9 isoform X3 [Natator depressus]|uniref:monocarboxylate transporter 9 isoform X3 n=1 Tax=Natator depressus TaxID=27790 RepID=UPI003EBA565E
MVLLKSPDGGWGWVIVLVSFFTQFFCYGSPLAVGVLYLEWLDTFGEGKGKTAWIGSLASGVGLLASSSVGLFIYAALQRELIELYGLDGCLLIVGALSLNILACGSLMRPLELSDSPLPEKSCLEKVADQYLIYHEKENVEENTSILEKDYNEEKCVNMSSHECKQDSILNKNGLISIHAKETDTYKQKVVEQTYFCKQLAKKKWQLYLNYWEETLFLFKNKVFSSLFIAILLFDIGGFPPSLLMEDVARSSNISEEEYVMPLISILGIMTAVGKLVLGVLADFKWINTLYLYVITLIMTGVALVAIPFAKSYILLAILSGILGFLSGNWSIFPYVTTKTVGIEKLAHAYGVLMFFAGLGNSLGPPIVGWFYDWTQTYDTAFCFSGLCVLLGGLLLLVAALPCWDNCNNQSAKPPPNIYSYTVASSV